MEYRYTFLRHSESEFNKFPSNNKDPPLTYDGKNNAKTLKGDFDYVLISFMGRTIETFNLSSIVSRSIEYSSLCREMMDHNSNLLKEEKRIYEKYEEFVERMKILKSFLIEKSKKYNKILIVTHQRVILELTEQDVDNGTFVKINHLV